MRACVHSFAPTCVSILSTLTLPMRAASESEPKSGVGAMCVLVSSGHDMRAEKDTGAPERERATLKAVR